MEAQDDDRVRPQIRTAYAKVATGGDGCSGGCCGTDGNGSLATATPRMSLRASRTARISVLGCGNPQAFAALHPGATEDSAGARSHDLMLSKPRAVAEGCPHLIVRQIVFVAQFLLGQAGCEPGEHHGRRVRVPAMTGFPKATSARV
jgi:hypothetical protein